MSDLRELYQEVIIDHNKNPRNFYKIALPSHQAEGFNPLCGDRLSLYLSVSENKIHNVSFEGAGCAISTASASLMTEMLIGKTIEEADKLFSHFHTLLVGKDNIEISPELGKLKVLAGVKDYPARVKCATLAWHTYREAISGGVTVSTE